MILLIIQNGGVPQRWYSKTMRKIEGKSPDLNTEVLAGLGTSDQDHEQRLQRYGRAKTYQEAVQAYIKEVPEFSYGSLWGVKVPNETVDEVEAELHLKPYVDLVYRYALDREKYELMQSTDFGELSEVGRNPARITRTLNRPDGFEIDGKYHDAETVREYLDKLEDAPF